MAWLHQWDTEIVPLKPGRCRNRNAQAFENGRERPGNA